MSVNAAIAERFGLIAKLLDVLGEDSFRSLAHVRAARAVMDFPDDLEPLARAPDAKKRLQSIEGVGPKIADKIVEFVATGRMKELDDLRARVPEGLVPLMDVPGLGPKTLAVLWQKGGVKNADDLQRIIADGSILSLPRMGEKSVQKLKDALEHHQQGAGGQERLHLGVAGRIAARVVAHLQKVPGIGRLEVAGSLRRGKETIGDIDLLATARDPAAVMEAFRTMPGVQKVLATGDTKTSVRLIVDPNQGRWKLEGGGGRELEGPSTQCDLRVVPEACFGAALLYFTGSKEHNVRLRQRALERGLTLNEYGLFPEDPSTDTPPQDRGIAPVACDTEDSIYAHLGLHPIPPELREDKGELDRYEQNPGERSPGGHAGAHPAPPARPGTRKPPAAKPSPSPPHPATPPPPPLITVEDIRAELHAHTTASDGTHTILALAQEAKARGFHTIAVTDHSKSSAIAGGLPIPRLLEHIAAIREAQRHIDGITILAGSEVDILADGTLDYPDDVLAQLDIVVASPHASLGQDPAAATARLVRAVSNPFVRILGHPTGRLINRRPGLSPDMAAVIAAAKANNVALEINAHWMRLDLRDTHVRQALDAGALIAIDCDVHEPADFDNLRYGVITGRRGGLTPDRCINTWPADRLHAWLKRPAAP